MQEIWTKNQALNTLLRNVETAISFLQLDEKLQLITPFNLIRYHFLSLSKNYSSKE